MCVVSMVMDHYRERWGSQQPSNPQPNYPYQGGLAPTIPGLSPPAPAITPEEVAEFKRLLDRAREYDKRHAEPDCELESKKAAIRQLAKDAGVEIAFLW